MNLSRSQTNELLYVGFNQDFGCFACGTDSGFRIYNCNPFRETFRRDFANGGVACVEMLFRCNILALVGGGRNPRYPPNKVLIWDDHQGRCIGELSFRSEVRAVKLRRDRVVVVLHSKIYVYNFSDLRLVDHIETFPNPKGLIALCAHSRNTVLACPGVSRGTVRVELYDLRKSTVIHAHDSELAQIALNLDGTRIATASDKGTLIRVFDSHGGDLLQELRRGTDRADIYSLAFSSGTEFLAASSDKGTVHVFAIQQDGSAPGAAAGGEDGGESGAAADPSAAEPAAAAAAPAEAAEPAAAAAAEGEPAAAAAAAAAGEGEPAEPTTDNSKSSFAFMRGILPSYFSSEWSFAQYRVPSPDTRTICAFGSERQTLLLVGSDGSFTKASFDANGNWGTPQHHQFVRAEVEEEGVEE